MTVALNGEGYAVNRKRVQRLMQRMGVAGVAPGPHNEPPASDSSHLSLFAARPGD